MKTSSLLQILVCSIMVLSASCGSKPAISTETPSPVIAITSFPSRLKVNGINVEFSGYEVHDTDFLINICFNPPRDGEWFFGDIDLKIGDQNFQDFGVSRNPNPGRADGFECETIIYHVNDQIIPSGEAELTIGRLGLFTPVEEQNCKTAQKHLDEAKTGITVTCNPAIASSFTVSKKPVSMSDEEAFLIAHDAFAYSEAIPLNWMFSFFIEKP